MVKLSRIFKLLSFILSGMFLSGMFLSGLSLAQLQTSNAALPAAINEIQSPVVYGGNNDDFGCNLAIDQDNNFYITGDTLSTDLPMVNGYDITANNGFESFLTKYQANGDILWSTYLGGSATDFLYGTEVDSENNVIIAGNTYSNDFPVTTGAYDTSYNGGKDVYLAKFSTTGSLLWSTFFGGSKEDHTLELQIDQADNIYVTGYTYSSDFPVAGVLTSEYQDSADGFIAKFSASGSLLWSVIFGGSRGDIGNDVTVDTGNNVIVTGLIQSTDGMIDNQPFPIKDNTDSDGFVIKFDENGQVLWTFLSGDVSSDVFTGITADTNNNIYIIGKTKSTTSDVGQIIGPVSTDNNNNVLVTKVDSTGSVIWTTIIGGSANDEGKKILINYNHDIILTGTTTSTNFPTLRTAYTIHHGGQDVFFLKLQELEQESGHVSLLWSMLLGGPETETVDDIALYQNKSLIFIGDSKSSQPFSGFSVTNPTTNTWKAIFAQINPADVPGSPIDITIRNTLGGISLKWSSPEYLDSLPIVSYSIYKSQTSKQSEFSLLANISDTSFIDTAVTSNIKYYYVISAWNELGEGAISDVISLEHFPSSSPSTSSQTIAFANGFYHFFGLVSISILVITRRRRKY